MAKDKKTEVDNYDKSSIHLPRQQLAFSKESSKYKGCGEKCLNF